jgi:hypothetical protein
MDYSTLLTTEQKKAILEQRIAQFASEAYQHDLNKKLAGDNEEAIKHADDSLAILNAAITLHQDELNKLGE